MLGMTDERQVRVQHQRQIAGRPSVASALTAVGRRAAAERKSGKPGRPPDGEVPRDSSPPAPSGARMPRSSWPAPRRTIDERLALRGRACSAE